MGAIIFLDLETTGLDLDDDIWEFAAIRREEDGSETEHHAYVQHDVRKCKLLPESFLADHEARFPASHDGKWHRDVIGPWDLNQMVVELTADKPHIVGAVPNFDTERLARLLDRENLKPTWHYHLIDVENLVVGWLAGSYADMRTENRHVITPPWDSEDLSRAVDIDPDQFERHTAMGDAKWARAIYDQVMGMKP